ncbi:hypothetical protein ABZP36_028050 [Zizania latifolia]
MVKLQLQKMIKCERCNENKKIYCNACIRNGGAVVVLERCRVALPWPNVTCDIVLCFYGIWLHQIGSLRCPAAFAIGAVAKNTMPTTVVKELEKSCHNASYTGCSRYVQSLQKPPMKEPTEPIDVVLHSEIRAVVCARFDYQVAYCNSFLEKLNMEMERHQKLDEEIKIKQLRKEQVPVQLIYTLV